MTFVSNLVGGVFKPSLVALAISTAAAVVSLDTSPQAVRQSTVDLSALGCDGLLYVVCLAVR
ncbi:hypothetical protein [Litoreibacter roseus]|uniref:Uncharacterized protein n=1 Tax=Litoreibacter roseus TaxID=2601869 RepID=A0A6N6JGE5_9RHOB|nr:hypothetical protein [Litoreibacter roseus]GFE65037.1 hypothetical protein KIN_21110 [Litoreibacter roseus]